MDADLMTILFQYMKHGQFMETIQSGENGANAQASVVLVKGRGTDSRIDKTQ